VVAQTRGEIVSEEQLEEMGPIDYVVLEWKGEQPDAGEVQPLLLDLVDRGIIRILDIAFLAKDEDGSVSGIDIGDLKQVAAAFAEFEVIAATATASRATAPTTSARGPASPPMTLGSSGSTRSRATAM
jgi:hypothetical protein